MKRFALFILLPLVLLYGGCKLAYPTYGWHQKLTLVVETPDGVETGSAVTAVLFKFENGFPFPEAGGLVSEIQGEATVVDLGEGRYLFALIVKNDTIKLARASFPDRIPPISNTARVKQIFSIIEALKGVGKVPLKDAPLLVTFGDLSDPASVMRVDPADLAATFGAGFALREITLEITDDAVTDGVVEGVLGCLNSGKSCIPLNKALPYGNPMRNITNNEFRRLKR